MGKNQTVDDEIAKIVNKVHEDLRIYRAEPMDPSRRETGRRFLSFTATEARKKLFSEGVRRELKKVSKRDAPN